MTRHALLLLASVLSAGAFADASPFTFAVSSEPQLPCTNYAVCAGFENGIKTLSFAPVCRSCFEITNVAYEGQCALWSNPGGAHGTRTGTCTPAGTTNRLAVTVKLGPEHGKGERLGMWFILTRWADATSGGKVRQHGIPGVYAEWQADSTPGWVRIQGEPFTVPPDATDINLLLDIGSFGKKVGGFIDNVYCGPAWTELSFRVENAAGLAQVLVEDENGERIFCDQAFPENLTKYEKTIRVSAAMRYRVRAVDRLSRVGERWYPSPRPQKSAAKTTLSAKGRQRFWMPSAKDAVFDVSLKGEAELKGATLEAVVRDASGREVYRGRETAVLVRTPIKVPLAKLADGRHLFTATFREASGRTVAVEAPVDFWKIPAKKHAPTDRYTIKDRNIYRNGEFFFPLAVWGGAPGYGEFKNHRFDTNAFFRCYHRRLEEQRALGFNTILTGASYYPDVARVAVTNKAYRQLFAAWDPYQQIAQLPYDFNEMTRLHAEHGLGIVPYLHIWHPAKANEVDLWLSAALRWREADNIFCWHLSDEMDGGVENNALLNQNHHEVDPDRLTWINFINGSYANRDNGDILSEDPYPVPGQTLSKVTWNAGKMDGFVRQDQSMFLWLQMFGNEGGWTRAPRFDELKAMVYMSLNHGVRGIAYFNYYPSILKRNGLDTMTEADYAKLGPFNRLLAERARIWCLGKRLSLAFDDKTRQDVAVIRYNGSVYVSAVNSDPKNEHFRMKLPAGVAREGVAEVVDENRTVAFRDGLIEEDFTPLAVRLYRIRERADFKVADFGAKGDGLANDTTALQTAIEAAAQTGGGRVVVGPGTYRCGSLRLRSHVELHLEKGATLVGGTKSGDYADFPTEVCSIRPENSAKVFLYGWDLEDVAITGEGAIDGRGPEFFDRSKIVWGSFWAKPPHPRPRLVQLVRCRNVRLEGVTFRDSPGWTMLIRLCTDVTVEKIRVVADKRIINSDGIDFDGCRRVRVRRSSFSTGDDCLIVRSMREEGSDEKVVSEDLSFEDCELDSACQCIRMGCPSDDVIRNVIIRNIRASGRHGINFDYPARYLRSGDEGFMHLSNVLVENFSGTLGGWAFRIGVEPGVKLRKISGIRFENCNVTCARPLSFVGNADSPLEDIVVRGSTVSVPAGVPAYEAVATEPLRFRDCTLGDAYVADRRVVTPRGARQPLKRAAGSWEATDAFAQPCGEASWIARSDQAVPGDIPAYNSSTDEEEKKFYKTIDWQYWDRSSVRMRKRFAVSFPVKSAFLEGVGLGYYEIRLNGREIDAEHVLKPVKTLYQDRAVVKRHDVTAFLTSGTNVLEVEVAHGWFSPSPRYRNWHMQWQGIPCARFELSLARADGTVESVVTDATWEWTKGDVWESCIYDGEKADLRPRAEDWQPVQVLTNAPVRQLVKQVAPDNRVMRRLKPVEPPRRASRPVRTIIGDFGYQFPESPFGTYVYDFGENITGRVRFKAGAEGLHIIVRYGEEVIDEPFRLDPSSKWAAAVLDEFYIPPFGEYAPRFTYHGFRYAEVELRDSPALPVDVMAEEIYADVKTVGTFTCGSPILNRIHEATVRTQRGCLQQGVPVDCPQRDERLGWLGDAHVTVEEALDNFDLRDFYAGWLEGVAAQQAASGDIPHVSPRPGVAGDVCWSAGYAFILWENYRRYGDRTLLERHYPHVVRYVDYLAKNLEPDGTLKPSRYGDWHMLAQNRGDKRWVRGQPFLVASAYYHRMLTILAAMGDLLGKADEAAAFRARAGKIRAAAEAKWYDRAAGSWGTGIEGIGANALALFTGLAAGAERARVHQALRREVAAADGCLTSGILGTQAFFVTNGESGDPTGVWDILTRTNAPSYAHMLRRKTNLCEQWEANAGSFNHVMFGSVDAWLHECLAGLNVDFTHPDAPLLFRPQPVRACGFAEATRILPNGGKAVSSWRFASDGTCTFRFVVPKDYRARLVLPDGTTRILAAGDHAFQKR